MASLSLSEIRKRAGRVETLVNKIKNGSKFDLTSGSTMSFVSIGYTRNNLYQEITPSKSKAEYEKAIKFLKTDAKSADKIILVSGKNKKPLTVLLKSAEFGGSGGAASSAPKGNRGDMAEAIFGAAITARFLSKTAKITKDDVLKIIAKINATKMQQSMVFDSPNKNPKIVDKLTFRLGLALPNLIAVTDKNVQSTLTDIVNSSVNYANSKVVMDWADLLYNNNKYNEIEVVSDGIGDQTGTKVDVRIIVDGVKTDVNVSLKADEVKQFGQVGGSTFEAQTTLWKQLLNIDVSKAEENYYKQVKKKNTIGALKSVYSFAADEFNKSIKTNKSKTLANLSKGIKYFATLNEENVTLVQLTKNEATVYEFDNLEKLLKGYNLQANLITTKATPEIQIGDGDDILVTIRIKTENKPNGIYVRNYVEKGKLLTKIASHTAT
jgi:hypothetical protein